MTVSQKATQDVRRSPVRAADERSMGDEHASTALPPTLFKLKNLTPNKPANTTPSASELETAAVAPPTVTESVPASHAIPTTKASHPRDSSVASELHTASNANAATICDTAIQAATKSPTNSASIPSSDPSLSHVFFEEEPEVPAKSKAPAVTLAPQPQKRNWQQLISANALVIAMLLLVIIFAVKVSRRATQSSSEPSIADSQLTDLLPPEDLVVFADEDMDTDLSKHVPPAPATKPPAKANVALMSPDPSPATMTASEFDAAAPANDPKLSAGTPASTVSNTRGIDPAIAALNATVHSHKPPTSDFSTSPIETSNVMKSGGNSPDSELPDLSAAKPTSVTPPAPTTPQESATPRGISNWEQYLPSQPVAN
ncbi:hypothetical protein SH528x_006573 [Novipirellula sp. SH528]|uniref:hypothetical protein n=1 Tax=Novipirellula sp. SH528 TaxID=3454466 RepID=UPI003F9FDA2E